MILMSDSQEHLYRRFRWRAISISIGDATFMPRSLLAWLGWAWGQDLWIHGVPLIKLMVVANLVMWALLWFARP